MYIVGYYDDTLNKTFEEEFETEAKAQDYINNKLPAYVTPYMYDLDKANEQDIDLAEQRYYEQLAEREAEMEREESEESYEVEI